jgi:hypothetical protein
VGLHDVIHAYLREQTHHQRAELNRALIEAHRGLIGNADGMSAWWQLPGQEAYLWAWLPTHLHRAGLDHELQACLHHPKWLVGKLEQVGPAGLEADLALSDDPLSSALGTVVRHSAHLLAPLQPPGSLAATLASRLQSDQATQAVADQLVAGLTTPYLRAITTPPDLPRSALSRVPSDDTRKVTALVAAPDSSWLASADTSGEVRVWDPATGAIRHTLTGCPGWVLAGLRRPGRAGSGLGSHHRQPTPHPHWSYPGGPGVGGRPGWGVAGLRRPRRGGTGLGPHHRQPTPHPHRP